MHHSPSDEHFSFVLQRVRNFEKCLRRTSEWTRPLPKTQSQLECENFFAFKRSLRQAKSLEMQRTLCRRNVRRLLHMRRHYFFPFPFPFPFPSRSLPLSSSFSLCVSLSHSLHLPLTLSLLFFLFTKMLNCEVGLLQRSRSHFASETRRHVATYPESFALTHALCLTITISSYFTYLSHLHNASLNASLLLHTNFILIFTQPVLSSRLSVSTKVFPRPGSSVSSLADVNL